MDFKDSPEDAAFRAEVVRWLAENAPRAVEQFLSAKSDAEQLAAGRAWQRQKALSGFVKRSWPRELGGGGGTIFEQIIFEDEERKYVLPNKFFRIGLGMPIPIMRQYATEEQKQRFIAPALRGEEIWCQLFSEPGAGSDLAALSLRAERDGDDWVLNGQKVWTSFGHVAQFGTIVARSDATVPKHKGLTYFFLDMNSPGIEVRPIRQLTGEVEFSEVFFTDVRVPDTQRLGAINEGWSVTLATLMVERHAVSDPSGGGPRLDDILRHVQALKTDSGPAIENSAIRNALAEFCVQEFALRAFGYRMLTEMANGKSPGPEGAIGKLVIASKLQKSASFAMELAGLSGLVRRPGGTRANDFTFAWLEGTSMRIAGGTDEILRNTIAERILEMPRPQRATG